MLSVACETAASDEDASDEDGEDEEAVPVEQEAADTASVKARNSEPSFCKSFIEFSNLSGGSNGTAANFKSTERINKQKYNKK